jgi:hypothetical protein
VSSSAPGNTSRLPPAGLPLLAALLLLITAGCREQDEIRRYQPPKVTEPEPKVRLLAAVFPHGEHTWFFKLAGPIKAIDDHARDFIRFVSSVRFPDGGEKPTWTLPTDWKEEPGAGEFRYATIHVDPKDPALQLTVSKLGRQAGSLLANVNRWRDLDLGLGPISEASLPKVTSKLEVAGNSVTVVKMEGPGADKGKRKPPFMLDGHPPVPSVHPAPARSLVYHKPEGWKELNPSSGGIRLEAAFEVTEGGQVARITVLRLGGGGRDLLANVNRWRQLDLGLGPIEEAQLGKIVQTMEVAGTPASFVDLAGPEGANRKRVLGVAVPHGGQTWFFTMKGPADLVGKQKAVFEAFVRSVKFAGGARTADE